ncbi:MAG: hypothetical protein K0Q52_214 [Microbacterium sp.]|jgi:hypothetical protein|nr:hypothetical protein [Microbacterium sp.]
MSAKAAPVLQHRLAVSRRALRVAHGQYIFEPARAEHLPEVPPSFKPETGTYREVASAASKLNAAQERSSFLDYLYWPEPVKEVEHAV